MEAAVANVIESVRMLAQLIVRQLIIVRLNVLILIQCRTGYGIASFSNFLGRRQPPFNIYIYEAQKVQLFNIFSLFELLSSETD